MSPALRAPIWLGLAIVPLILRHFLKKTYQKLTLHPNEPGGDKSYYQCIFFDTSNFNCKPHLITRQNCGDFCSYAHLEKLLRFISSASQSVSICVYMLTLKQVTSALVDVSAKKGVIVRVITDRVMGKATAAQSNLKVFNQNGILYRTPTSDDLMMHHKFCLIDEKHPERAKVFFGSTNLTAQAFTRNFETLILTNNRDIVRRFSEEFEELWTLFDG